MSSGRESSALWAGSLRGAGIVTLGYTLIWTPTVLDSDPEILLARVAVLVLIAGCTLGVALVAFGLGMLLLGFPVWRLCNGFGRDGAVDAVVIGAALSALPCVLISVATLSPGLNFIVVLVAPAGAAAGLKARSVLRCG